MNLPSELHHKNMAFQIHKRVYNWLCKCQHQADSYHKTLASIRASAIHQIWSKTIICWNRHSLPGAFRGAAAEWLCLAHCRISFHWSRLTHANSLCTDGHSRGPVAVTLKLGLTFSLGRLLFLFLLGIFQIWLNSSCFFAIFSLLGFLFLGLGSSFFDCLMGFD